MCQPTAPSWPTFFSCCICTCTLSLQSQLELCADQPIDLLKMVKRKAENQARSDSKKSAKNLKKSKNSNASIGPHARPGSSCG